jgi:NTP pyrophosphatase (non-canonical NTP hydrolase)
MELAQLTERMHRFVESKGWYRQDSPRAQLPRNLAISLAVEAGEMLELFQWTEDPEPNELAGELADIALYLLQLAAVSNIDLEQAILTKLANNQDRDWPGA